MICLLARRRLGAYLGGALDGGTSRAVIDHLDRCPRCRREIDTLRRMAALLRGSIPVAAEPDWTGFWPGIARGILDAPGRGVLVGRRRWGRRWLLGGVALATTALVSLVVTHDDRLSPFSSEESVLVTAADTQYPGGTMVYHAPDTVAVVWVFDE